MVAPTTIPHFLSILQDTLLAFALLTRQLLDRVRLPTGLEPFGRGAAGLFGRGGFRGGLALGRRVRPLRVAHALEELLDEEGGGLGIAGFGRSGARAGGGDEANEVGLAHVLGQGLEELGVLLHCEHGVR